MTRTALSVFAFLLATSQATSQEINGVCECDPKCLKGEVCVKRCPEVKPHCSINDNFLIEREAKASGKSFTITTDQGITANITID